MYNGFLFLTMLSSNIIITCVDTHEINEDTEMTCQLENKNYSFKTHTNLKSVKYTFYSELDESYEI